MHVETVTTQPGPAAYIAQRSLATVNKEANMGDRTHVTLYIPSALSTEARPIMKRWDSSTYHEGDNGFLDTYTFDEVSYGDLPFLPLLAAAGIPYDSDWLGGMGYGPGSESVRFTPEGDIQFISIEDVGRGLDLGALLPVIEDHAALKELILDAQEMQVPLPWDNQVEYGKIYRTKQLITPQENP